MPSIRATGIAILAIAMACASAAAAAALVFEDLNPQLASKVPLSSGFAKANLAQLLVSQSGDSGSLLVTVPRARSALVRKLSLESYKREPLNSGAVAGLALSAQAEGNIDGARALMGDAESLSRRTLAANVWTMADAAKKKDLGAALGALDNALRTSDEAEAALIQSLVQNLTHPELIAPLARLLQDRPPWSDDFWHQAFRVPAALPNVAQLRLIAHQRRLPVSPDDDRALLDELTRNRLFSEAEQIFAIVRPDDRSGGEMVRNASYASVPQVRPFDWQLFFDESLTADVVPSPGQLVLRVYEGGGGRAARQLIDLAPGQYALAATFAGGTSPTAALTASLTCAEDSEAGALAPVPLRRGDAPHVIAVPDGGCRYYWLDLNVAPDKQHNSGAIQLDSLSLKKLGTKA